jgi:hypothetical protein
VGSVAAQGEVQLVFVAELLQLQNGVSADSQNLCTEFVQFFFGVTELVRLAGSTGGVGLGKEKQNDGRSLEVIEPDLAAGIRIQRETRSFVAHLEHDLP